MTYVQNPRSATRRDRNAELTARLAVAVGPERDQLREELALQNMDIARAIARRYGRRSDFIADLEQTAHLALVRATKDFDPLRGHEFLAYAGACISGEVKRYFRDSAWMVRPPRPVQSRHSAARGSNDHVADGVQVETCFRPWSLDAPVPGDSVSLGATISDHSDRTWEQCEARLLLEPHLRALAPRAQQVLHQRFVEDLTQQQIADNLGVSQYQVSRLLSRYVRELRESMTPAA